MGQLTFLENITSGFDMTSDDDKSFRVSHYDDGTVSAEGFDPFTWICLIETPGYAAA